MKVRIIKSKRDTLWYSNRIGTEWEVKEEEEIAHSGDNTIYVLKKIARCTSKNKKFGYGIFVSDCEIVHEKISLPDDLFEL